jgi:hypothetical protein
MVQIVNGFSCYNSADAALAKRGIDPGAAKAKAAPAATAIASTQGGAMAGSLSTGLQPTARSEPPQLSALSGGRGQFIDLIA